MLIIVEMTVEPEFPVDEKNTVLPDLPQAETLASYCIGTTRNILTTKNGKQEHGIKQNGDSWYCQLNENSKRPGDDSGRCECYSGGPGFWQKRRVGEMLKYVEAMSTK